MASSPSHKGPKCAILFAQVGRPLTGPNFLMETVLVVDDTAEGRELAASCLHDHGMKVLFAENGVQAQKVLAELEPDAVLTDLHMPEMGGLELVEFVRSQYSNIPVVLMTSKGNEQIAVDALKAGALSYVPKKDLRGTLCEAMGVVVEAVEANRFRERTRGLLEKSESRFVLGYEMDGTPALVSHLQNNLRQLNLCDETGAFQVSTALAEALGNAIDHGNLELDSLVREKDGTHVYAQLRQERSQKPPYRDRKVHVVERITPDQVTYVVRDEGKGFDHSLIPNPTDAENLLKASGRGLMLIRTFMDDTRFNETGNEITMVKRRAAA